MSLLCLGHCKHLLGSQALSVKGGLSNGTDFSFSFWTASLGPWTSTFSGTSELGKASSQGAPALGLCLRLGILGTSEEGALRLLRRARFLYTSWLSRHSRFCGMVFVILVFLTSAILRTHPSSKGCLHWLQHSCARLTANLRSEGF